MENRLNRSDIKKNKDEIQNNPGLEKRVEANTGLRGNEFQVNKINSASSDSRLGAEALEAERLDAALGCVIGAFIGDALGSAIEFKTSISKQMLYECLEMTGGIFGNGPGQVTDDSELAMCLLNGLCGTLPEFSMESIAHYYKLWIRSDPFDLGRTCRSSLGELYNRDPPLVPSVLAAAEQYNKSSQSNGSFMRCSPLAVWCRNLPSEDLVKVVQKESSFTHSNQTIQQAQSYYVLGLASLIQHPKDKARALNIANDYLRSHCNDEVKAWVSDIQNSPPMPGSPNMGHAKIAFDHTFRQLNKQEISFVDAMAEVLSIGGDTDTNACIVGAMIGCYVGYNNLPIEWKTKVENFNPREDGIQRPLEFLDQSKVKNQVIQIFHTAPYELKEI
jgi:ADP-ribosyl-[dinitrogen reductase] hydrolase